jgi:hypothetical protein
VTSPSPQAPRPSKRKAQIARAPWNLPPPIARAYTVLLFTHETVHKKKIKKCYSNCKLSLMAVLALCSLVLIGIVNVDPVAHSPTSTADWRRPGVWYNQHATPDGNGHCRNHHNCRHFKQRACRSSVVHAWLISSAQVFVPMGSVPH